MSSSRHASRSRRLHATPLALAAGLVASAMLALSLTGTFAAFTAAITNDGNTATTGTLVMEERDAAGSVTCRSTDGASISTNAASCSRINKFGGTALVPGRTSTSDIVVKNVGTVKAGSFTLTPGTSCTQTSASPSGSANDLCSRLTLVLSSGATVVFSGTLAEFVAATPDKLVLPAAPAAGGEVPFRFEVRLDANASNSYQGLTASVPMTWAFAA